MLRRHPVGFWFVLWGELAERASFYGMRTLLALYLLDELRFSTANGASVMQFFQAACYLTPLLGGWVADRKLGRYWTIVGFAGPYILGHIVLGGIPTTFGLALALPLLALGSGAIKPNTSTLMGMIYEREGKTGAMGEAFSWFYAAINVGAAASSLALPLVRDRYGYGVALTVPAVLMAVAFAIFAAGKPFYPVEKPSEEVRGSVAAPLRRLGGVFALIAVFWFVYDQSASTWVYFARDHLDLALGWGITLTADQIQGVNPLLILVLTPVFNAMWPRISRSPLPATRKMLVGFGIVVVAMAIMAVAGTLAGEGRVSVWWMLLATLVITMAELCISVIGLEFAFREAGPGAKSAVTAAFLLTVFVGDLAGGVFARLYDQVPPGTYFALQTAIIAVAAVVFARVARRFEGQVAEPAATGVPAR